MAYWLLKTEPGVFSFDDLVKARQTAWDGVTNALALKYIRSMVVGDEAFIYHTGDEKAAVGIAGVTKAPYADPKQADDKLVIVDVRAGKRLAKPVSLAQMKTDPRFAGSALLRIGRLSVVPLTEAQWKAILQLAGS